jgi:hypothetical protein
MEKMRFFPVILEQKQWNLFENTFAKQFNEVFEKEKYICYNLRSPHRSQSFLNECLIACKKKRKR